jgi:aminoglycoside 6'-N-acetyltransferase I
MSPRPIFVRPGVPADLDVVARSFFSLRREGTLEEHRADAQATLHGASTSTLPLVIFVAADGADGEVIGIIEVGLRSHADGCDMGHPVGFVEGWFVDPGHRGRGVGAALMRTAEDWAKGHGCREMASDTWTDNELSERVHQALGYEVVDRCIHFRKALV